MNLDDGRCLQLRQPDLLSAVANLAQRRTLLDDGCDLLLDPLPSPSGSDDIVLLIRLERGGDEIGRRHTTSVALDAALHEAWSQLQRYARHARDDVLLDELLIPHTDHYWPGSPGEPEPGFLESRRIQRSCRSTLPLSSAAARAPSPRFACHPG